MNDISTSPVVVSEFEGNQSPLDPIITFLRETDELDTAEQLLDTFAKYARSFQQYDDLAKYFFKIKKYEKAEKFGERALTNAPGNEALYVCRSNLAKVYNHLNEPKKALRYVNINLKYSEGDPELLLEKSFSHFLLNEKDIADQILREMELRTDLTEKTMDNVKFNLGTYDLYRGKFKEGLNGFLVQGRKVGIWKRVSLPYELWEGGIMPGRKIICVAEGGIGDELVNVRFVKNLQELGMEPVWWTSRDDVRAVFKRCGIPVTDTLKGHPSDSLYCYSMQLPVWLDLDIDQVWKGPYLWPSSEHVEKWELLLDLKPMLGLRWAGNPLYDQDLHRTVPLDELVPAVRTTGAKLVSFQRDHNLEDLKPFPEIVDLSGQLETLDDLLAAISQTRMMITSCTAIVHAAGAIGHPTVVLPPISAYYTWSSLSTHDETSPWYGDNLKVFRQTQWKSWKEPLEKLKRFLESPA